MPRATRQRASAAQTVRANRSWWDNASDWYQTEHGGFLRDTGFVWGPEGLDEADARLLGDVRGRRVLEVGCGAGQCGRWLIGQGARVVGLDLSQRQLQHSRRIDAATGALKNRITDGEYVTTSVDGVDDKTRTLYFTVGDIGYLNDAAATRSNCAAPDPFRSSMTQDPALIRWCLR